MDFIKKRSVYGCWISVLCVSEDNIYAVDYIYILVGPKSSVMLCDRCFEDLHFYNKCEWGEKKEKRKKRGRKKPQHFGRGSLRLIMGSSSPKNKVNVFKIPFLTWMHSYEYCFGRDPLYHLPDLCCGFVLCSFEQMSWYSLYPCSLKSSPPKRSQRCSSGFLGTNPGLWQPLNSTWPLVKREPTQPGWKWARKCCYSNKKRAMLEPTINLALFTGCSWWSCPVSHSKSLWKAGFCPNF